MSTKYELATELRALTRGMKRPQICKMTKAQLETEIDRIKVLKQLEEDIPDYPPAKPGPLGPRAIPVAATKADDDLTIAVPQAPAKHYTEATKPTKAAKLTTSSHSVSQAKKLPMRIGEPVAVHFDDTDAKPVAPVAASVRAHPTKALPSSSSGKFSHPGAPKRSHTCNCPMCPEKTVV